MSAKAWKIVAMVLMAAFACPAMAAEEIKKINDNLVQVSNVSGTGATQEEAERMAKRRAVEVGAGAFITSESQMQDFVLMKDTVLARAAGFCKSWTITGKPRTSEDGLVTVTGVAEVTVQGPDSIQVFWATTKEMLKSVGHPKIMVFINEKMDGVVQEDSTVQTRIEKLLIESGFELVNREQVKAIAKKDMEAAAFDGSPDKMQAIAKRFGAQLFISGSTNSKLTEQKSPGGVSISVYGADGDIKCYQSDTANMVASLNGAGESADRNARVAAKKAIENLGDKLAPQVRQAILQHWSDALQGGHGEVQIEIEGINAVAYVKLKKALGEFKEVKSVSAEMANGIAKLRVKADCTAEQLMEKLVEGAPYLDITDLSQNVIKGKLKP